MQLRQDIIAKNHQKMSVLRLRCLCSPPQDEGGVLLDGEAAHPPEAHHPEDGDHDGGERGGRAG